MPSLPLDVKRRGRKEQKGESLLIRLLLRLLLLCGFRVTAAVLWGFGVAQTRRVLASSGRMASVKRPQSFAFAWLRETAVGRLPRSAPPTMTV